MSLGLPQAVLLVDGYNVVGQWHELKLVRDREGLEESRRQLIEILTNYSAFHDFDTRIIFDAQYREDSGAREVITRNLSVHFTQFGQTADSYIEKACAAFRNDIRKFHQRLIVATNDRAQQLTVIGYGAEWLSTERLAHEVAAVVRRVRHRQKPKKQTTTRLLGHSLHPDAKKRLSDLRFGRLN